MYRFKSVLDGLMSWGREKKHKGLRTQTRHSEKLQRSRKRSGELFRRTRDGVKEAKQSRSAEADPNGAGGPKRENATISRGDLNYLFQTFPLQQRIGGGDHSFCAWLDNFVNLKVSARQGARLERAKLPFWAREASCKVFGGLFESRVDEALRRKVLARCFLRRQLKSVADISQQRCLGKEREAIGYCRKKKKDQHHLLRGILSRELQPASQTNDHGIKGGQVLQN